MKPEELANWYFRLNGFFTITNFVLHPARRGGQLTDADILGIRFPYRSEFPDGAGEDSREFTRRKKAYFVMAEVKRSICVLNGPWTDPSKENIDTVLRNLGPFPNDQIQEVARSLYQSGNYDGENLFCSLYCVGDVQNPDILTRYPDVPQLTWEGICDFMSERFGEHRFRKADHDGWDEVGKLLWSLWDQAANHQQFVENVRQRIGLPPANRDGVGG